MVSLKGVNWGMSGGGRCIRDEDGRDNGWDLITELADGNAPRIVFEAGIQDNLRSYTVDSAVEQPSITNHVRNIREVTEDLAVLPFNGECKHR
jgi:hypothetical protein